jgi:hypothetical protein
MGQEDCQVNEATKRLLDVINKKLQPPPGQDKVYISYLTFMDARSKTSKGHTQAASLINHAIARGLSMLNRHFARLAVNEPGHIIPNTDANVNRLFNILFDPNLTPKQKLDIINDEIMAPNNVDVIVTGLYVDDENNSAISFRPVLIVKYLERIVTKSLQFTKYELICRDPNGKKEILCQKAHDKIIQAFSHLLEQL